MCLFVQGSRKIAEMQTCHIILLLFIIINTHIFKRTHVISVFLGGYRSQWNWYAPLNYLQSSQCKHTYTDANKLITVTINKLPLLRHSTVPHLNAHWRDPDSSSLFQWIKQVPIYCKIGTVISVNYFYFTQMLTENNLNSNKPNIWTSSDIF